MAWMLFNVQKHLYLKLSINWNNCCQDHQWKISKLHKQLHFSHSIYLYGSHQNIHTGPQEHNHIANKKKPSKHTQKRKYNFDWQLGNQLNDQYSIDFTHNIISFQQSHNVLQGDNTIPCEDSTTKHTKMASKFQIYMQINSVSNKVDVSYK